VTVVSPDAQGPRLRHDRGDDAASEEGEIMRAGVGDRLMVRGHRAGDPIQGAEVLEVRGADDGPPYLVRWDRDGHESLLVPSSDVTVVPAKAARAPAEPAPEADAEPPEARLRRLEDGVAALERQLERLREDVRALAAAVREAPPA
jgi:hypothetical protein